MLSYEEIEAEWKRSICILAKCAEERDDYKRRFEVMKDALVESHQYGSFIKGQLEVKEKSLVELTGLVAQLKGYKELYTEWWGKAQHADRTCKAKDEVIKKMQAQVDTWRKEYYNLEARLARL